MLSDTLTRGLEAYGIGGKIRQLRQDRKMGLVQLGRHTALSSGMLSKIERGQLFPTLPTLLRIALVFGVGLEHFFAEADGRSTFAVVRRQDRLRLPDRAGSSDPAYYFESLDFPVPNRRMEAYYASFPAGAEASAPHRHEGAELIYVLQGRLVVDVGGTPAELEEGDALYFDPSVPHTYRQQGRSAASAIVVVTPS
jgi:quercetin dioxygenase-like cupin family protein/DNA-binding XRE family transcriptional regulator